MNKYRTQPVTTGKKKATDGPKHEVMHQQMPKQLKDMPAKQMKPAKQIKPVKKIKPKKDVVLEMVSEHAKGPKNK